MRRCHRSPVPERLTKGALGEGWRGGIESGFLAEDGYRLAQQFTGGMKSRFLFLLTLTAAGFAAGSVIRHFRGPVDEPDAVRARAGQAADVSAQAGDTSAVAAAVSNPVVAPLARPSLGELRAASMDERLALLVRWLPEATADEVAALAAEWFGDDLGSGGVEWQVLAVRWVEVDPVAAVAFARARTNACLSGSQRGPNPQYTGVTPLHPVYRALARLDPDLTLAFLSEESPNRLRNFVHDIVDWVGAEKAQAWTDSLPEGEAMDLVRVIIGMRSRAADEPAPEPAPLTAEEKIERTAKEWGKWREMLPDDIAAKVAELTVSDPVQARAVLDSMPAHLGRARLEAIHVAALARTDLQAALQAAEKMSGVARLQAMAGIAAERARTDPAGALKLMREHGIGDFSAAGLYRSQVDGPVGASMSFSAGTDVLAEALKAVAAHDPAGTLQLLAETDSLHVYRNRDPFQKPLAVQLLKQWAGQDPAAAAQWVGQQSVTGVSTSNFVQSVAGEWIAKDAAALQQFAVALPTGWVKDYFARETAALMAPGDPAGALAWVAQTGSELALGTAFRTMATHTPEVAAAHFATLPAAQQEQQLQHLADTLARRAPVAAFEFFHSLPVEQQAAVELRETALAYAKHDPQAASTWIASLPPTEARDTAIGGQVEYLVKES